MTHRNSRRYGKTLEPGCSNAQYTPLTKARRIVSALREAILFPVLQDSRLISPRGWNLVFLVTPLATHTWALHGVAKKARPPGLIRRQLCKSSRRPTLRSERIQNSIMSGQLNESNHCRAALYRHRGPR